MLDENTISDTIERWLDGALPVEEARAFEARMAEDAGLREKVEGHRRARAEIEAAVFRDFKRKAAVWRDDLDNLPELPPDLAGSENPRPGWKKWAAIVVLLLVLLAGAFWLLQKPSDKTPKAEPVEQPQPNVPVAETEQPAKSPPAEKPNTGHPASERVPSELLAVADGVESDWRGSLESDMRDFMKNPMRGGQEQESSAVFREATEAFLRGDFPTAKRLLLPTVAEDNPNAATAQKMLADIFYRERDFSEAARYFEAYAKTSSDARTEWRLLHFYLKDYPNRKTDFWRLLDSIAGQEEHRYQLEAKSLREKLEKAGLRK